MKRSEAKGLGQGAVKRWVLAMVAMTAACVGNDPEAIQDPPSGPTDGGSAGAAASSSSGAASSSSSGGPATGMPNGALDAFWATFHAGDIDGLKAVQAQLVAARAATPNDPGLSIVVGMSYVWANAENARATTPMTLPEMQDAARATLANLQDGTKLAPNEPRAWAHLGTAMVTIGGATGNTAMRDQGQAMVVEKTMPVEKAEGAFALAAAMSQAPLGSAGFDQSIEYFFTAFEDCLGKKLDRSDPDFSGYDAKRTTARPKDVCFNQPHWPHAEEGNFLVFGDTLVKANKIVAAKKAYAAALAVPEAGTWKYKSVVEGRLAEDLTQRMRSYRVPGATAASVGASPFNCVQCHQR